MGKRRSELTTSSTGFLSFGPYRKSRCGLDVDTNTGDYPVSSHDSFCLEFTLLTRQAPHYSEWQSVLSRRPNSGPRANPSCTGHIRDVYRRAVSEGRLKAAGELQRLIVAVGADVPSQAAWAAQFVVSKRRVLANEYQLYKALSDLIEVLETLT